LKLPREHKRFIWFVEWFAFTFTLGMFLVMYTPVANWLAGPLVVQEELKKADLIVVLGGGSYRNSLTGASSERLLKGLILYREGYAPRIIFSGGAPEGLSRKLLHTVLGIKTGKKTQSSEADLMGSAASRLGVPDKDRAIDEAALDTYENLINVGKYMSENGLKTCLMVTSPTHMRRAELIARKLGLECYPAPISDYTSEMKGPFERLALFKQTVWEYGGLAVYRLYGYI
jgi:uncharacterized SAM-binding protein YcdF (DUF218 family)